MKRKTKSIQLNDPIIKAIEGEAKPNRRSFSGQVEIILSEWAEKKSTHKPGKEKLK